MEIIAIVGSGGFAREILTLINDINKQSKKYEVVGFVGPEKNQSIHGFPVIGTDEEINKALGCEPIWDANPEAKDKTIGISYDTDLTDPDRMEDALNWLVQQTITFYNVFSKEVKEIKI